MFNKEKFKIGKKSRKKLDTCHEHIKKIFEYVINYYDFSVLEGFRTEEIQNNYYDQGKSKLKFPQGKHNKFPSLAIDVAPYPIDWNDIERFNEFARFVQGIALGKFGIRLRWGGDWNGDFKKNESFIDCPHFELHSRLVDDGWVKYE